MKTLGIFVIIVLILIVIYFRVKSIYDKVSFEFGFNSADLSSLNISSLLLGGQTQATLLMSAKVINGNNFAIGFNDLRAWIYYNNTLIAQTTDNLATNQVIVQPHSSAEISDNVTLYVNQQSVLLLGQVISKQQPKVQYTVKLTIWGIPITWSDNFIWVI